MTHVELRMQCLHLYQQSEAGLVVLYMHTHRLFLNTCCCTRHVLLRTWTCLAAYASLSTVFSYHVIARAVLCSKSCNSAQQDSRLLCTATNTDSRMALPDVPIEWQLHLCLLHCFTSHRSSARLVLLEQSSYIRLSMMSFTYTIILPRQPC